MRLDKFLCHNLGLTRTQAKSCIKRGLVIVDDKVTTSAATHIASDAEVEFDGNPVRVIGLEYFMLNKPQGYVSTNQEGLHPMIFDLLDLMRPDQYHAAGRLDIDTTGLVLITNDGQWSHRVTSPRKQCGKVYQVELAQPLMDGAIEQLEKGVMLHGEKKPTKPAKAKLTDETTLELTLFEGKYHQVKRMLAAVENRVVGLHRVKIGDIALDPELELGEYRPLTDEEINSVL